MTNQPAMELSVDEALRQGNEAYRARDYARTEKLCRLILQKARIPAVLNLLGNVCVDTERVSHGVDLIRRACLKEPTCAEFRENLEEAKWVLDPLGGDDKVLYAFYDLQVSPVTFDFITFLIIAGSHCIEKGCGEMVVVFVPGDNHGFRAEASQMDSRYSVDAKRWRLRHVLEASSWLSPYCRGTMICRTREEAMAIYASTGRAHVFPETYHPAYPAHEYVVRYLILRHRAGCAIPTIRPTPHALIRVNAWLERHVHNKKVVTLTLRETSYVQERNSNTQAWIAFAQWLDKEGYAPVFLRDEETAMGHLPEDVAGYPAFNEGVWNVDLRAALYDCAFMNALVANGPGMLSICNSNARTLIFKPITPSWYATSAEFLRANLWEPGTDLPSVDNRRHKWIWQDDEYDVLVGAFQAACAAIENPGTLNGNG